MGPAGDGGGQAVTSGKLEGGANLLARPLGCRSQRLRRRRREGGGGGRGHRSRASRGGRCRGHLRAKLSGDRGSGGGHRGDLGGGGHTGDRSGGHRGNGGGGHRGGLGRGYERQQLDRSSGGRRRGDHRKQPTDLGGQRLGAGHRGIGPLDGQPRPVVRLGDLLAQAHRITTASMIDPGEAQRATPLAPPLEKEYRGSEHRGPSDGDAGGAGRHVAGDRGSAERGDHSENQREPSP